MPDRALVNEAACSHHPADPGGATVKGITQRICNAHLCCPPALQEPRRPVVTTWCGPTRSAVI
ncbi:MAG: hypothetical protein E5V89_03785 [Mesorhizobium sp.]|uniref:glycosyl hydrolase 108 family protein n=1 Tax=Mesorhizobium sp. TaxID=1871066 RepID=UPI000FE79DB3|nr:MAG: hypothetical protein EOS36_10775 [Mesorhizobium sp.]RWE49293.1 MAG: hypothetical protein EOS79_07725 [Mesorhizobium sp.]TIV72734.1 MAG: hypothetical protein E5V89_03785 [Mesorhizobium sp.]